MIVAGVLAAIAFLPVTYGMMDDLRSPGRARAAAGELYLCALIGLGVTALLFVHHRLLHLDALRPGQEDREGVRDRPRDQHHPGPRVGLQATALPALVIVLGIAALRAGRHLRHRRRRDGAALADRPDRRAGRVRPDHRQRGRHRRDGRHARGRPQRHRPARRGRQHDQGRHQGVRDRLGRARRARAVRRLQDRARRRARRRASARSVPHRRPGRADRPADRRHDGVPVRLPLDGGRRPRRRRRRRGGAPPVPREARDHGGHREARLRAVRRHRDQGGAAGDDPPVADPDRRHGHRRRPVARCSAAC